MAAAVYRLRPQKQKLRDEQASEARQRVLALDVPEPVRDDMLAVIEGWSPARAGWTFVMLEPAQNAAVVRWLMDHSALPRLAVVLWAVCFEHQRRGTDEIRASRAELAAAVGTTPRNVSRIMSELVAIGAVLRSYQGRRVVFSMNPQVSTKLTGKVRDRAQATAPRLSFKAPPKTAKRKATHLALVPQPAD